MYMYTVHMEVPEFFLVKQTATSFIGGEVLGGKGVVTYNVGGEYVLQCRIASR